MAQNAESDVPLIERFEPEVFWEKHGSQVITGGLIVVVIAAAVFFWQRNITVEAERAAARLAAATDVAALEQITRDYAGKPVAAEAMLRLADMHYRAGRYDEAAKVYQAFLLQFPRNPFVQSAQLGMAAVQESLGNLEAALTQYQQIFTSSPQSYAAPTAKMGAARCAEALGKTKEAAQLYEELMALPRGAPLQMEAYMRLLVLNREKPATPTTEPAAQMPPGVSLVPPAPTPQP